MWTPDDDLKMQQEAYEQSLAAYNEALASGIPTFLLTEPIKPELRMPRPMTGMKTPFATRKWRNRR